MNTFNRLFLVFAFVAASALPAYSQWTAEEIEAWVERLVETENPVYMPVIGVGTGFFNYHGGVKNAFNSFTSQPGYRINLSMFTTNEKDKQFFRLNATFMTGNITGTQRYVPKEADIPADIAFKNMNFRSNIMCFGFGVIYSFKPLISGKFFEPFVSLGVQTLQFNTDSDRGLTHDNSYYFWTDGTIRDAPQNGGNGNANIISRNFNFNDPVKSGFTVAVPLDVGIDFNLTQRVSLRVATSFNYAFDDISDMTNFSDNYKKTNSIFSFTYLSLIFDPFSDPLYRKANEVFIDLGDTHMEYAMMMIDDEDGDGVSDWWDLCPDTPWLVEVDEDGCPFDSDDDGVPDYLDDEPNSRPGAMVDERGVEISEDDMIALLNKPSIRRSEVEAFLLMQRAQNRPRRGDVTIPDKFKRLDVNNDGYISYDEFVKAISDFFDGNSNLAPGDLDELMIFFFEQ